MKMPMRFLALLTLFVTPIFLRAGSADYNTGMPFGRIGASEAAALTQYAKSKGLDIDAEMRKVYSSKDEAALARIFAFSMQFDKLDKDARTYGQLVYSSMLNLGGNWGLEKYASVLSKQDANVQQRIRDFLFYDVTQAPKKVREKVEIEVRKENSNLFPPAYVFGHDDPLFKK